MNRSTKLIIDDILKETTALTDEIIMTNKESKIIESMQDSVLNGVCLGAINVYVNRLNSQFVNVSIENEPKDNANFFDTLTLKEVKGYARYLNDCKIKNLFARIKKLEMRLEHIIALEEE